MNCYYLNDSNAWLAPILFNFWWMFMIIHWHKKETGCSAVVCNKSTETHLLQHQIYRQSKIHTRQRSLTVCLLHSWQAAVLWFTNPNSERRCWMYRITQIDASSVCYKSDLQGLLYFLVCDKWFSRTETEQILPPAPAADTLKTRTKPLMILLHVVVRRLSLCQSCLTNTVFLLAKLPCALKVKIVLISSP